jgi:4-alpha-glucanotransferase
VLLHPTSLPGGRLGPEAHRFVDWLADAGQTWWQVLPLGPPGAGRSPYDSPSAFAGWPGLLAAPRARVSAAERAAFRERERYWIEGWLAYAGEDALDDQVRFDREWGELRAHAAERGVRILGDIPFYVARDGADHRTHPHLFRADERAGVPPDAFSADGQLWGNPVYDWAAMRADGYRWWVERLRRLMALVDGVRIDHFRAFTAAWIVAPGARTAKTGHWRRGPGAEVITAARAELGDLPLVAEDLGVITPAVERLVAELGLPGMRVLQFAYPAPPTDTHRPANHPENALVYTGTHDNDTTVGWWRGLDEDARDQVRADAREAGIADEEPHRMLAGLALASRARTAILPAQDVLGLGTEARLNTPGTAEGNWTWALRRGELGAGHAEWLREAGRRTGRLPTGEAQAGGTSPQAT